MEQMAYVINVGYGYVDNQGVGLQVEVRLLEGGAMIFVPAEKVTEMIEETKIGNILGVKGKPIAVKVEDGVATFERFL